MRLKDFSSQLYTSVLLKQLPLLYSLLYIFHYLSKSTKFFLNITNRMD